MKFMLPVLFAIIFSAVTLFPQKAGSQDNTVPAVTNTSEDSRTYTANTPNQTEAVTWYPLVQNGYNGVYGGTGTIKVGALQSLGTNIYIGGRFSSAGVVNDVGNIVTWNGSAFSSLGLGVNSHVNAITTYNGNIVATGNFDEAGGGSAFRIALWNGESWNALGGGISGEGNALASDGTNLYVGGAFSNAGGNLVNYVAKWNGSSWSDLGSGTNGKVYAIAVINGEVIVAGEFTQAGGLDIPYIAKWNGTTWSSVGSGLGGKVNVLKVSGNDLYAGGAFSGYISKWNGVTWSTLGDGPGAEVNAIEVSGADVYVGTSTVRKYSSGVWTTLEAGPNSTVYALGINTSAGEMYVGGIFQTVGEQSASRIVKFTDPDNPLPVELTSFSAKRVSGGVELRWATATEVNNYGFEIERAAAVETMHASSLQERKWENIDFVPGHGNSNSPKQYIYRDNNSRANQGYIYRLKQVDSDGSFSYSGELYVSAGAPASFELKQNFPNPFNPVTMISYTLPSSGIVQLKIYNTTGEEVAALVNEIQEAGSYQISFNGSGLASGTYLYRITVTSDAGVYTQSRKMIILK
ncbi:MAG: T9SS type A sorting domain-containing protein [Ignavibacteriaceae bacterium]|nr:T9SS type A sorting domain-containing protein [Ignavibacteriaceae bacterium]